ncbi:MAG: PilZ domain-containing protein [Terriglobia bacterium]
MVHSVTTEQRQHRRYLIEGKAIARTASGQFRGEVVDVGGGGILLLCRSAKVTVGEPIEVRFAIAGWPVEIQGAGRVARIDSNAIGIAFAETPAELEEAILWLEASFLAALL